MNRDSINEYALWLDRFGNIYSKYINSNEYLKQLFNIIFEKIMEVIGGNNKKFTETDIIILLKNLVKEYSVVYDANTNINKSKKGPRNTNGFKQVIYYNIIEELKQFLSVNLLTFSNFKSLVMFVAKKRQMIEFLKLGNFEIFGRIREPNDDLLSKLKPSRAEHLYKEFSNKNIFNKDTLYNYNGKFILLTSYYSMVTNPEWIHTDASRHPQLFQIMNELYSKFLGNRNNNSKKDKLVELYWLYIQTCPFFRGSASIGEIIFSVLLRKYFNCDFLISSGWDGNPLIIPDIYALMYDLQDFKSIFWNQFTNINAKKYRNFRNKIIGQ
jgi:hypothetical protein